MDAEQTRVLERNPRLARSQSRRVTELAIIQKPRFLSLKRERVHAVRSDFGSGIPPRIYRNEVSSYQLMFKCLASNGVKLRVFIYEYDSGNTRTSPRLQVTLSPCRQHEEAS